MIPRGHPEGTPRGPEGHWGHRDGPGGGQGVGKTLERELTVVGGNSGERPSIKKYSPRLGENVVFLKTCTQCKRKRCFSNKTLSLKGVMQRHISL